MNADLSSPPMKSDFTESSLSLLFKNKFQKIHKHEKSDNHKTNVLCRNKHNERSLAESEWYVCENLVR